MPLDPLAEQYAQTLYLTRLEELTKKFTARIAETVAALAQRGIYAHNSGQFHTEMARIGIERIEELTDARVDALLTAYKRAGVPIDNDALTTINRAAAEVYGIQGGYLVGQVQDRARQSGSPAGVAEALAGTIEARMSQIKSRINYKLSALRDEAILDARSAASPEVPPPAAPAAAPAPPPEIRTPPIVSPPKSSIFGDIRKQAQQIWDASARWDLQTLVFVVGIGLLFLGEYAFGAICFFLAGFGLISRIAHNQSTSRWNKLLKAAGVTVLFASSVYIINDTRGSQPWSHLEKLAGHRNAAIQTIDQTIDAHAVLSQHLKPPEPPEFALVKTPRSEPKNPTPSNKPSEPAPSTTIQTAPTYGNLKRRTIGLANEVMSDLYSNGWPLPRGVEPWPGIRPMPTDPKERNLWVHYRSGTFRWKSFKRVVEIRDEFAQLHIHDEDLDQFIEREQNCARDLGSNFPKWPDIFPMEIEQVAKWLVGLANQLPIER